MLLFGTFILRENPFHERSKEAKRMEGYSRHQSKSSSGILVLIFIAGLIIGGMVTAYITYQQINVLKSDVATLQSQISSLSGNQTVKYENITIYQNGTALTELFENVKDSVVLVQGTTSDSTVQGSGFVYNYSGTMVVLTNYHVVHGTTSRSVTFSNGNGYAATINGTDPYADLAILIVNAPSSEFKPLEIVSSSTLTVGEPVIAIGNPYGLVGSLTTGVVSALGRTITEDQLTGGFSIANIIQTSTPINPGNSGGPLLNLLGSVVGITTAIVEDSQGLGFAIPSNTIQKEIHMLVTTGGYAGHSYLGVTGHSMDYELAQQYHVNVTYGWRIVQINSTGPSNGKLSIDDVIVGLNGTTIRSGDEMSSYLEEKTLPDDTVIVRIIRNNQTTEVAVELDRRPRPPV
jgi:S1-C subfamily serine protease